MALNLVLVDHSVSPEDAVHWAAGQTLENLEAERQLQPYNDLKHDFAPELLNLLRTNTMNILENGVAQSPKPSKNLSEQSASLKNRRDSNRLRRGPLFSSGEEASANKRQHKNGKHRDRDSLPDHILDRYMASGPRTKSGRDRIGQARNRTSNQLYQQQRRDQNQRSGYGEDLCESSFTVGSCTPPESTGSSYSENISYSRQTQLFPKSSDQTPNRRTSHSETGHGAGRAKQSFTLAEFLPNPKKESEKRGKGSKKKGRRSKDGRDSLGGFSQQQSDPSSPEIQGFNVSSSEEFPPVMRSNVCEEQEAPCVTPSASPLDQRQVQTVCENSFESPPSLSMLEEKQEFQAWKATNSAEEVRNDSPEISCETSLKSEDKLPLVVASPIEVTYKQQLDLFVRLYSGSIDALLFPNVSMELHFLAQLLIAQSRQDEMLKTQEDVEQVNVFETVHNVVYFAVEVMSRQIKLLQLFDHATLGLLIENRRVETFNPDLHCQLKIALDTKQSNKTVKAPDMAPSVVTFQTDTDNRRNFADDKSFHQSKRQRDEFYDLRKKWEMDHRALDWDMDRVLGCRVRNMFVGANLGAYLHFAGLFVSQLLVSCKEDVVLQEGSGVDSTGRTVDKSVKLTERLTWPTGHGGPCPIPGFLGHQQFFADFLQIAANPILNQHIINILATRIAELNEMPITEDGTGSEEDGMGAADGPASDTGQEDKEAFTSTVLTLRLLARFLGKLTFLPYEGFNKLPVQVQQDSLAQRRLVTLPLDMHKCLCSAAQKGRLALTVPWIAEFLAMMDHGAPSTASVRLVLADLRQLLKLVWTEVQQCGFTYSRLLVATSLGWLFDQPCMPLGYYFTGDHVSRNREQPLCKVSPESKMISEQVTQQLFFACCPYFGEMRNLLSQFSAGTRAKTDVRKVNPRPPVDVATLQRVNLDSSAKRIQYELMESFSLVVPKRSLYMVDFISEQISYNYIRDLRNITLPLALERCTGESPLLTAIPTVAQRLYTETRQNMLDTMESTCIKNIKTVLRLCSSGDTHSTLLETIINMACALTRIKVKSWISTCVTYNTFHKQLELIVGVKTKNLSPDKSDLHAAQPLSGQPLSGQPLSGQQNKDGCWQHLPSRISDEKGHKKESMESGAVQLETVVTCSDTADGLSVSEFRTEQGNTAQSIPSRLSVSEQGDATQSVPSRLSLLEQGDATQSIPSRLSLSEQGDATQSILSRLSLSEQGDATQSIPSRLSVSEYGNTAPGLTFLGSAGEADKKSHAMNVNPSLCSRLYGQPQQCLIASGSGSSGCGHVSSVGIRPGMQTVLRPVSGGGDCDSRSEDTSHVSSVGQTVSSATGDTKDVLTVKVTANSVIDCSSKRDIMSTEQPSALSSSDCMPTKRLDVTSVPSSTEKACLLNRESVGVSKLLPQTVPVSNERKRAAAKLNETPSALKVERGQQRVKPTRKQEKMGAGFSVYMLQEVQDLLYTVCIEKQPIEQEDVHHLIWNVVDVVAGPDENTRATLDGVILGLNQLAVAMVFLQPSLWTEDTSYLFVQLWTTVACSTIFKGEFSSLCNCITLGYLEWTPDLSLSLQLYTQQLATLIDKGCLTFSQIESTFQEILPEHEHTCGHHIRDILCRLSSRQQH